MSDVSLSDVKLLEPSRYEDERGWFMELWNEERYAAVGLPVSFAQYNVSFSRRGVLRGMHYQMPASQGKLVTVLSGAVFDAVVDLRKGSRSFAQWFGCTLSCANRRQLWVPEGFAHGFLVLSEEALVHYACTTVYDAAADCSVSWNDPDIGINWPEAAACISSKDSRAPRLANVPQDALPTYGGT